MFLSIIGTSLVLMPWHLIGGTCTFKFSSCYAVRPSNYPVQTRRQPFLLPCSLPYSYPFILLVQPLNLQRADFLGLQVRHPYRVVVSVSDVELPSRHTQSGRLVELREYARSVFVPRRADSED